MAATHGFLSIRMLILNRPARLMINNPNQKEHAWQFDCIRT
jgi:hypothetical protein